MIQSDPVKHTVSPSMSATTKKPRASVLGVSFLNGHRMMAAYNVA